MDFGLRCAYAHGVTAIRTHIDTYPDNAERSWWVLREIDRVVIDRGERVRAAAPDYSELWEEQGTTRELAEPA
jgi:cytosine/adenosine deaminase-related metal-dependent hydrolase